MTSPVVGSVSVEVIASARDLARSLKKEVESAFKDLDIKSAIRDAIGNTKIKLPVELDPDTAGIGEKVRRTRVPKVPVDLDPNTDSIPEKVRRTRVPKIPVEIDPLMAAFQQEIRRQTSVLARTVNAKVPVGADTGGLRAELGAALAAVQAHTKISVPTEPGDKAAYEARLKAQLAEVAARVKQHVDVKVDVDKDTGLKNIGSAIKDIGSLLPNIGGVASGVADLGGALEKAAGSSAQLGGNLAGAFESASGPVGLVVGLLVAASGAMLALAGAAVFAVPAIAAVAGAAAAIPAALAGAGAVFGTLALGFKGISEAFKPKAAGAGGGGSVVNQARQIAAASRGVESARRGIAAANRNLDTAERGLASAELNVVQAQERSRLASDALGKARKEARGDIEDLSRALRGAQLAEEDAALGVTDALRALNEAKLTGNIPDIQRADLAYREAQLTLENAKDSSHDLGDAQVDAAKKGVEGSDKVQAALRGQADAAQAVKDAQNGIVDAQNAVLSANDGLKSSYDGLASAQDSLAQAQQKVASGGAAAAAQIIKLAPAAQRFVDAIKALKPAFEGLRLDVQQRLFQGLDQTVTHLGDAWIPALKVTLGRYADTFNGFFRSLGAAITTPKFIKDLQAGAEGARQGFSAIGSSITTSLAPAFGALSRAAGPFLAQLGREIASIVTDFSNWVLQGEKSGGLKSFFVTASDALHDIFITGKLVTSIIGKFLGILVGSTDDRKSPLDAFNDSLTKTSAWLDKPENRQRIVDLYQTISSGVATVINAVTTIAGWLNTARDKFDQFKNSLSGIIDGVVGFFTALPGRAVSAISALPGEVSALFSQLARRAGEVIGYGIGVVAGFFYRLPGQISDFISSIPGRVSALFDRVVAFAKSLPGRVSAGVDALRSLPGKIAGFFSGLPGRIYNVGRDLILGLWNGISSLGTWLRNQAINFAGGIISGFKAGFNSNSPSKRMADEVGVTLPQGIAVGMDAGRARLLGDAQRLADDVVAASLPDLGAVTLPSLGAAGDLAVSRSLQVAAQQQVMVTMDPRSTGDWLMDGLRRNIQFKHRGDPIAALGSR